MALIEDYFRVKGEKERTEPARALMTKPNDKKAAGYSLSLSLFSFFPSSCLSLYSFFAFPSF